MRYSKPKRQKLSGKALKELVVLVYERDQHKCAVCGKWVEDGVKPHHVIYKSHGGDDRLENMVLLCNECHYQVHHGLRSAEVKDKIQRYLAWMGEDV